MRQAKSSSLFLKFLKKLLSKKVVVIFGIVIILFIVACVSAVSLYRTNLKAVSNEDKEVIIEVRENDTFSTLGSTLYEAGLIRSEFFYRLYIRFNQPDTLFRGHYVLNKNMSVSRIIEILQKGSAFNPDAIIVTIPEGRHITEVADIVASVTNNTRREILDVWNSSTFVDEVIEKYWFVTSDVKKSGIRFKLEGYLFPSTYQLQNADVTPENVAFRMLDQMERILNAHKDDIEKSKLTVHEILTMASIVEHEAVLDKDRALIAGVFFNRLNINMKLQSCATVGYAIGEWKQIYTYADLAVDSPYNTYFYHGLPIGPGNMPGEKSIIAALNPRTSDYLFFLADICSNNPETKFSRTYAEHSQKKAKYLTCN